MQFFSQDPSSQLPKWRLNPLLWIGNFCNSSVSAHYPLLACGTSGAEMSANQLTLTSFAWLKIKMLPALSIILNLCRVFPEFKVKPSKSFICSEKSRQYTGKECRPWSSQTWGQIWLEWLLALRYWATNMVSRNSVSLLALNFRQAQERWTEIMCLLTAKHGSWTCLQLLQIVQGSGLK